jgi:uncharacterized membrane protein
MVTRILMFADILWMSLVIGTMFGIWLGYDPKSLSAPAYIEVQRNAIRSMNIQLPLMAAVGIVLTLVLVFMMRMNAGQMWLLIGAMVFFTAAGLVTRFFNQPINAVVMTWSAAAPPNNWAEFRDHWWYWHMVRTALGIIGQGLLVAAAVLRRMP